MEKFSWGTILASLIVGFSLGCLFVLLFYAGSDFSYKDASIMTCKYANNLTDIINYQSDLLTKCSGGLNFSTLGKLNCDILSKGG